MRPRVGDGDRRQLDVLADHPAQHLVEAGDQLVQVEDPRLDDLPAREGQQLLRQLGGPLRRRLDLLQVFPVGRAARAVGQELGQRQDHRQQVVEVVRDAARQAADALHPLRQAHLLFQALAL